MIVKYIFIFGLALIMLLGFFFKRFIQAASLVKSSLENTKSITSYSKQRKNFLYGELEHLKF